MLADEKLQWGRISDELRAAKKEFGGDPVHVHREVAELERRWDDMVYQWTLALGFRYGVEAGEIAPLALAALGSAAQNATIARDELAAHDEMLRARYPVEQNPGLQP